MRYGLNGVLGRSAHPLERDRERGAIKRQRCSSVHGDYVFRGACKNDTVSVLIVYLHYVQERIVMRLYAVKLLGIYRQLDAES